jgi:hypothetical protein
MKKNACSESVVSLFSFDGYFLRVSNMICQKKVSLQKLLSQKARRKQQVMGGYKHQNTLRALEVLGQGCFLESVIS